MAQSIEDRRSAQRAAMSLLRGRRLLAGMCPRCGGKRDDPFFVSCEGCRKKQQGYAKKSGKRIKGARR